MVSQGHHLPLGHWGLSEWDKDVSLFALPGRTTLHQLKGQSAMKEEEGEGWPREPARSQLPSGESPELAGKGAFRMWRGS